MPEARGHIPVLLDEVLDALDPQPGETLLDCTAGLGGHSAAIAPHLGSAGTVILVDLDESNLERAAERVRSLPEAPAVVALHANFAEAPRLLVERGLSANLLLADLGFASNQIERGERGFSFQREGPLDMRLDPSRGPTAADLVATLSEEELGEIIRDFGEERRWRQVARKVVAERELRPIATTLDLARIVRAVVGSGGPRIDPATRTFQALRIAVNDELGSLDALLESIRRTAGGAAPAERWLAPGARVALITFHSLEDRRVKQAFADLTKRRLATDLTRRPVTASEAEAGTNPRSRSAKLRAIRLNE
jgi:16S rRNA (cytosine1402-N4)-methyltransferase